MTLPDQATAIIRIVAAHWGIAPEEITSRVRYGKGRVHLARLYAYYLLDWCLPDLTRDEIGQFIGGRSRSTIGHGLALIRRKALDEKQTSTALNRLVVEAEAAIA